MPPDFTPADISTPVLVLGGKENALSVARHLGRRGITVRVSGPANCWGMFSRYCAERFAIPHGRETGAYWSSLLLGPGSQCLHGHILMPCCDEAIEFIAREHDALAGHYILDDASPALQLDLLDKQRTLELGRAAGIDTPRHWNVGSEAELAAIAETIRFPIIIKPVHSHRFVRVFGQKLFIIEGGVEQLMAKARAALSKGLEIMIVEMIPGPDDLLSSYYTYIDAGGNCLFHFTKRVLRRYPVNRGNGCYHITEWLPETAEAGRRLFDSIGLRGFGNVEFKRDPRDGRLKLIEVNARFTAAHELIVQSGAPIDLVVYCHLTGQPVPHFASYRQSLHFWYPMRDFLAYLQLRKSGAIDFRTWLKSVSSLRHVYPLASFTDPLPMAGAAAAFMQRLVRGPA